MIHFDPFDSNSVARLHIERLNPELVTRIEKSISTAITQRETIKAALVGGKDDLVHIPIDDVTNAIGELLITLDVDLKRIQLADDAAALTSLEAEHVELRHRQLLSQLLAQIELFISDKRLAAKATSVRRGFTTRPITEKENELFSRLIEGPYRQRFQSECELVNCQVPISFQAHGRVGETRRYLELEGGHEPKNILSEGEQKAIALADFLTETALNPSSSGIVLDDPVTSLDHERKQLIAKRLVKEAATRQVVILTHDLVFMSMVLSAADEEDVPYSTHWVEKVLGVPGYVRLNDSPASSKEFRTTRRAEASLQRARDAAGNERVSLLRQGMGELRRTVEEIVQLYALKEVVGRWRENIMVTRLKTIAWDNAAIDEIDAIFADLSRFIEGHSHSDAMQGALPDLADLETLIGRVNAIIPKIRVERPKA